MVKARRGPRSRPLPHDFTSPPSQALRASPLAQRSRQQEQERRERLLLLGIINHPELLHDFLDDYAAAEFTSRELDSLKRQIIDMAALAEGLDGSAVKDHLNDQGFGPVLARLESQAARLNEWFLNPGAASADARTALRQMFALHRKSVTLDRELQGCRGTIRRRSDGGKAQRAQSDTRRAGISCRDGSPCRGLWRGFGARGNRTLAVAGWCLRMTGRKSGVHHCSCAWLGTG